MTKWDKVNELRRHIQEDDTLETCVKHMKCYGYAPNIDYVSWIFTYKGVFVALYDAGNGHYDFNSAVTIFDLFVAKLYVFIDRISRHGHLFLRRR